MRKNKSKNSAEIKAFLNTIERLPTLPFITVKLLEATEDEFNSAKDIAKLIETDQALTAKSLKMANSAYYGRSGKISTIREAVVLIGFNAVRSTVLSISVMELFKDEKSPNDFDIEAFWLHSLACAICCKEISHKAGIPASLIEEAFVCGMLHDVGKILLIQYLPEEYSKVMKYSALHKTGLAEAEKAVLGMDHSEVGSELLLRWKLPSLLSQAIAAHHQPPINQDPSSKLAAIVYLSNIIIQIQKIGHTGAVTPKVIDQSITSFLGLTKDDINEIASDLDAKVWDTANVFGLKKIEKNSNFDLLHESNKELALLKSLAESEEKYRILFEGSSDAIFLMSDVIFDCNKQACRLLGCERGNIIDHSLTRFFPKRQKDSRNSAVAIKEKIKTSFSDKPHFFDFQIKKNDGVLVDTEISIKVFTFIDMPVIQITIRDISERKQMEETVRKSEERYRLLVENANSAILIFQDNLIKFHNKNTEKLMGRSCSNLSTIPFTDHIHPGDRRNVLKKLLCRQKGGRPPPIFSIRLNTKKGKELWGEVNTVPIDWDGKSAVLCFIRDITEQKIMESKLQQVQRMEAIGRLAGGIAHDFNNMMMVVTGYSELLLISLPDGEPMRKHILEIKKAGEQASRLTRQLLVFSRKQALQSETLDFNTTVIKIKGIIQRLIGEDIELVISLENEPYFLKADPSQMEQILMNITLNARDAMPLGGRITIETKNVNINDEDSLKHADIRPGPYIRVAISDTGEGIEEEILPHIFEPFYSTKTKDKGTGLGLATVYGIIKQCNGHIMVSSEKDKGTIFKIYLPRAEGEIESISEEKDPMELPKGSETVLLVEDEAGLLKFISQILLENEYKVLEANNAVEALQICEEYTGLIHLMLTDIVMPKMNGPELADRLKSVYPEMKVLFMSGYGGDIIDEQKIADLGETFLEKPVSAERLLIKMREVLESV